jgi:hypothetical protein
LTGDQDIQLRSIERADVSALAALGRSVFNTGWDEAYVDWKYFKNPAGPVYGACAALAGQIVASFGNLPVRLKLGNEVVAAAQAVDAMVLPQFRRQKLFDRLARQTYADMDSRGVQLTYVFPAPAAHEAFIAHHNYVDVAAVPRYVRVVDADQLAAATQHSGLKARLDQAAWMTANLRRRPRPQAIDPNLRTVPIAEFDPRFDGLWQAASSELKIAVVRDAVYLNWRYTTHPQQHYTILTVQRGEALAGCIILAPDAPRSSMNIIEFIAPLGDAAAGCRLLDEAASFARRAGMAILQCWLLPEGSISGNLLKDSHFVHWPMSLAPGWLRYTTPFVVRAAGAAMAPDPRRSENWFLTMGDHDYY